MQENSITIPSLAELIQDQLPAGLTFKPNKLIYNAIGINQKRFGMILRGKADPTIPEARRICAYFNINIHNLIS